MQTEDQVLDHERYIDSKRKYLSDNREKYEAAKNGLRDLALEMIAKVGARLMTVNSDSEMSKSVWVVAQCREILVGFSNEIRLIDNFEQAEKKVMEYDKKKAQEDA